MGRTTLGEKSFEKSNRQSGNKLEGKIDGEPVPEGMQVFFTLFKGFLANRCPTH
jgi:hypothetical protein